MKNMIFNKRIDFEPVSEKKEKKQNFHTPFLKMYFGNSS